MSLELALELQKPRQFWKIEIYMHIEALKSEPY